MAVTPPGPCGCYGHAMIRERDLILGDIKDFDYKIILQEIQWQVLHSWSTVV